MEWVVTLQNMPSIAAQFWQSSAGRKVFAFYGEMGSGKTTFIHALCDAKQIRGTVGSPSFSIINEYSYSAGKIFHIDLYRLKDEDEAIRAGVEDCLFSGEICLVEWPQRAARILPPGTMHVAIDTLDPGTRKIRIDSAFKT